MRRTLKYRLYRSKHESLLTTRIEYASEIWNHFVALSRRYYRLYGTYPGYYKLKRHLTKLKKQHRFEHWNRVGSQAAQMVIKRLDLSYQAYFDWFFKTAHALCDGFDFIGIEDLSLKGMQMLWGRKVSDLAFGEFVETLTYVCQKRGVVLHQVERYYPSSKTCSQCGAVNQKLTLSDRHWRCGCGVGHCRDHNASINIRDRAWSLFRSTVRPLVGAARAA